MKILFISTGFGVWPNVGWGACENLTYELSNELRTFGHSIYIYHSPSNAGLRGAIQEFQPDVVHCEYDDYISWMFPLKREFPHIKFRFTNHWAYLTSNNRHTYGYQFFNDAIEATRMGMKFYCLSPEIADVFIRAGAVSSNIRIFHNGANDSIRFADHASIPRAVCVGKVEFRKGQQYLADLPVDIIGPIHNVSVSQSQYIGHWPRSTLFDALTNYSTLVLLSDGEAHPLVVCEAMMAGLSLVISRVAAANIDTARPWVHIVEPDQFGNKEFLRSIIQNAIENNEAYRSEIRAYAIQHFSWKRLAAAY